MIRIPSCCICCDFTGRTSFLHSTRPACARPEIVYRSLFESGAHLNLTAGEMCRNGVHFAPNQHNTRLHNSHQGLQNFLSNATRTCLLQMIHASGSFKCYTHLDFPSSSIYCYGVRSVPNSHKASLHTSQNILQCFVMNLLRTVLPANANKRQTPDDVSEPNTCSTRPGICFDGPTPQKHRIKFDGFPQIFAANESRPQDEAEIYTRREHAKRRILHQHGTHHSS